MEAEEPSIRSQLHRYYGLGAVDGVPEALVDKTVPLRNTFATPHEAKEFIMDLEAQKLRNRAKLMSRGNERAKAPPLSRSKSDPLMEANKTFDDILSRYDDWHRSFTELTQSKASIGYSPTKTKKKPILIEPIPTANSENSNIAKTPLVQKLIWGNDRVMIHTEDHSVTSMSRSSSSIGFLPFADDNITPAQLKSSISLQATKHRQHLLHKNKQELSKLQDVIDRNKALEQENMTTNIASKRLIHGFRQQILNRLMSKNENLAPSYMRYFNEEAAAEFLKQYNGCTISIDAIIAHIGNSLGEKKDKVAIPTLHCKKPKISKFTSQFMKVSRNGVRRPHDPYTDVLLSMSPEQLREKRRKQKEDDEESVFSQYSQQAGDASPTVSETSDTDFPISPGNASPNSTHNITAKDKRKGGGYKSKYSKATTKEGGVTSVVEASAVEHNLVDYKHPEYTLKQKQMEAIELVQSQLVQEKMLPSLFPQQVLTEEQLTKLGTGTSFDEIFKSIQTKKMMESRKEQSAPPSPIRSKEVAVKRVYLKDRMGPPIALATRNYPLKVENENTPAESPYLSLIGTVPDKTKILAYGIPAGSGLSLWSGKRVEKRVVKPLH